MTKKNDKKARTKKQTAVEEFWYDPMCYPAFMKKKDDDTPLL